MNSRDWEEIGNQFDAIPKGPGGLPVARLDDMSLDQLRVLLSHEMDADGAPEEMIEEIRAGKVFPTAKEIMDELVHTFGY